MLSIDIERIDKGYSSYLSIINFENNFICYGIENREDNEYEIERGCPEGEYVLRAFPDSKYSNYYGHSIIGFNWDIDNTYYFLKGNSILDIFNGMIVGMNYGTDRFNGEFKIEFNTSHQAYIKLIKIASDYIYRKTVFINIKNNF